MSRPLAAALFLASLAGAGPPQARCGDSYTVARGDTLYSIARRCRSSVAAIAAASRVADPRRLQIGQRLVIPGTAAKPDEAPPPGPLTYRIQPADTLYSLARWSRVSLAALMAANPGIDPHKIEIGDAVRLPAGATDPARARERERGRAEAPPPPAPPRDVEDDEDNEDDDKPESEPDPTGM